MIACTSALLIAGLLNLALARQQPLPGARLSAKSCVLRVQDDYASLNMPVQRSPFPQAVNPQVTILHAKGPVGRLI